MDKLYWGAVVIFAIGWYIEQRMYVDGYTRRKRDPYKPIDYLGVFSIGEFVGYLIRSLVAPAFVWFPDILIGMPDNLIQAIAAVWLVVMSIFVPTVIDLMRRKHKKGEFYYWILYYAYLSPQQCENAGAILQLLETKGISISLRTYYVHRDEAIEVLSSILWGYTSQDCEKITNLLTPD